MGSKGDGDGLSPFPSPVVPRKQSDLKKSFSVAVRSLLTACPKQGFSQAFPNFTIAQQERLHQLFIQVITSLHGNMEVYPLLKAYVDLDEFESLCMETQVEAALYTLEQFVEEQRLDPLFSHKTNMVDVVHDLSTSKKAEIQHLRDQLGRAEEHNRLIKARIELLKNRKQDVLETADAVEKLRGGISSYGECKMSDQSDP